MTHATALAGRLSGDSRLRAEIALDPPGYAFAPSRLSLPPSPPEAAPANRARLGSMWKAFGGGTLGREAEAAAGGMCPQAKSRPADATAKAADRADARSTN